MRFASVEMKKVDRADHLIENDPAFLARIEEAYAEYQIQGGISAEVLIKKLEKRLPLRGEKK